MGTLTTERPKKDEERKEMEGKSKDRDKDINSTIEYEDFLNRIKQSDQFKWPIEKERILLEPYSYLTSTPGKEIRSLMIDSFNFWLKIDDEQLSTIKKIVGQLHTASLLMDDVEDGSELRRGIPVAHKIYGIPQTINSANYVYFLAYQELSKLTAKNFFTSNSELWSLVNEELLNLHRGQGMDLYWRDSLNCPTEQEYIEMVKNKTGGLFRIAIKLMMAMSPMDKIPDYIPLVDLIGVIFQIRDDYLNLSSEYTKNKGFCEDLTEGKFSFPVVHSIRADKTNHRIISKPKKKKKRKKSMRKKLFLLDVLRQRPTDDQTKQYAVNYMKNHTKSLNYTQEVLKVLEVQAFEEVSRLGDNPSLRAILNKMHISKPLSSSSSSSTPSSPPSPSIPAL